MDEFGNIVSAIGADKVMDGPPTAMQVDDEYYDSYNNFEVHQLMVSDFARTNAYQKAIERNSNLFQGKIIMDVGAGTGILSLFCAKAGAKKVYAIEASGMSKVCEEVVKRNGFSDVIEVLHCRVEDLQNSDCEKVDVIVSEWMGFYLFHESMLASVLHARDNFLAEDGKMFPHEVALFAAPCTASEIYKEQLDFWNNQYGFDFSPVKEHALQSKMIKPEITHVGQEELLSNPVEIVRFDLLWLGLEDIAVIKERHFVSILKDGQYRALSLWFECYFGEDENIVTLSTSPCAEKTHWKQTLIMLPGAVDVEKDDVIGWELTMSQNQQNPRHYVIAFEVLDPVSDEHPVPCNCMMAKCAVIQAFMEQDCFENVKEKDVA